MGLLNMRPRRQMAEPMSQLAVWSRRLALFAAAIVFIGILGLRGSQIEPIAGLGLLASGLLVAAMGLLLSMMAFAVIWRSGARGLGRTMLAMGLGILMLAPLGWLAYLAVTEPVVADVSTDLVDPPKFEAAFKLRPRGSNAIDTFPGEAVNANRSIRPPLTTAEFDVEADRLFPVIVKVAESQHWRIVETRKPARGREGRVEAVARTAVLGLRDDVVIRIRGEGDISRVDLRSASRVGRSDLGVNARRIHAFLAEMKEAVDNIPDAPAPRPQQRQSTKPRR